MQNCAVIGLGIGMAHVAGYLKSPHAKLTAVCDLDPRRLSKVGGTFAAGSMLVLKPLFKHQESILNKTWEEIGVRATDNIEDILNDPSISLVSLCTPDYTHEELMLKILRAGKHLLLEKPVSIGGARLEALQKETEALCKAQNLVFSVGYEFRINPAILKLKGLCQEGALGEIKAFSIYHYRTPFRRDKWNHWIQKKEYSGGLLVEETCHWFDLARYITGKEGQSLHAVSQDGFHPDFDYEDIAFVQGTYQDGAVWQISHALTGFDFSLQISVHGTGGTAWCSLKEEQRSSLDNSQTDYLGIVTWGPMNGKPSDAQTVTYGWEATEPQNICELAADFARCVDSQIPLTYHANFQDGRLSLQWALAAGQSALQKTIIPL